MEVWQFSLFEVGSDTI